MSEKSVPPTGEAPDERGAESEAPGGASSPADASDAPDAFAGAPEDPAFAALLKRSLDVDPVLPGGEQRLLTNVQRKLRERSRGKFYGDGWSTGSSRVNYVLIALVMLAMVLVAYLALGPTGIVR